MERANLMSLHVGIPCVPVIALGRHFYPLSDFPFLLENPSRRRRILDFGKAFYHWADGFWTSFPLSRRVESHGEHKRDRRNFGIAGSFPPARALIKQSGRNFLLGFLRILLKIRARMPVRPAPGDLLLMPDLFWGLSDPIQAATDFREKGGTIIPVIFDLIPLRFPQYCHDGTAFAFSMTLPKLIDLASGILTISRSVSMDLENYLTDRSPRHTLPVDFFYPGADMVRNGSALLSVRAKFKRAGRNDPFYLMVGTIQPHKGHLVVLETFERLWSQGFNGEIIILGRLGGKGNEVLRRMRSSSQFGMKFFVWHDANDAEVDLLYRHTRALIIASYAEGFGLPLVEAMYKAVPVIASDLPVFREIAGDYPCYFSPGSPEDLIRALSEMENRDKRPIKEFEKNWLTWDDSVKNLLEKVREVYEKRINL